MSMSAPKAMSVYLWEIASEGRGRGRGTKEEAQRKRKTKEKLVPKYQMTNNNKKTSERKDVKNIKKNKKIKIKKCSHLALLFRTVRFKYGALEKIPSLVLVDAIILTRSYLRRRKGSTAPIVPSVRRTSRRSDGGIEEEKSLPPPSVLLSV